MLSNPMTFLVGYMLVNLVLSFGVAGPLVMFGVKFLSRRTFNERYISGIYFGASVTSFLFIILHYVLYLWGYRINNLSDIIHDAFYSPMHYY